MIYQLILSQITVRAFLLSNPSQVNVATIISSVVKSVSNKITIIYTKLLILYLYKSTKFN